MKCAICLETKGRANFAICDRCEEGAVCCDCASQCNCSCIGVACPESPNLVQMLCPVCNNTIVFDAGAPAVSKTGLLRIMTRNDREVAAQLVANNTRIIGVETRIIRMEAVIATLRAQVLEL